MPRQQWLPPTPEEEALQQPDYTPWDAIQTLFDPQTIAKRGITKGIGFLVDNPYRKFSGYDKALSYVSQGGTKATKWLLKKAIKNEPDRIAELQGLIKKEIGDKVTLYRVTRGRKLSGIESFTDDPKIAKEIGADVVMDVPVHSIVGYAKYQPHAMNRSLKESEVLVDIDRMFNNKK